MAAQSLPGPRGLPLIGHVTPFIRHGILGAFDTLAKRHGPCYRLPLPFGNTAVVLAHPDGVERVLRSNRDNYIKGAVYDGARLLLGEGLVTAEGQAWERQRALAQPAFNSAQLTVYLRTMTECTEQLLGEWRKLAPGESINLSEAAKVTAQYQSNITQLESRLQMEDTVLGSVVDNLQRARELAIQGLNDTNSPEDQSA